MPENPASYRVVRTKSYLFNKAIIVHPHFDDYDEHIKVIEVAGYYIPRTDKGRKTIEKCGLLRFAYKYANYGGTSQENKETILTLANCLLDANGFVE
ncbi:hypothetical protein ACCQ68_19190 [Klebsiella pneumoniae]